ncbi:hypothetical protein BT93_E2494 [Corymbia citriodora subsp. variegata]|nr:hypothetical protein BT93_E2494 [Corymbia citriodora subsp. variegata]
MDLPNLLLLLLLMFASTINAQFPATYCGSTGNFTANSTYETTLTILLSSISTANDMLLGYGIFNVSAPVIDSSEILHVYGLCHGDYTVVNCRICLIGLAANMSRLCPLQKEAIVYTGNCIIRYSNTSFLGTLMTEPSYLASTTDIASSPDAYDAAMRKLLDVLLAEAARGGSSKKYASGDQSVGPDMIYALVQCTPDLTEQQCNDCLDIGIQEIRGCCVGYTGVRFMVPNCLILYVDSVTEPLAPPRPPPPPPPPPPPSQEGDVRSPPPGISYKVGKSNKSTMIIIAIAVTIGGVMVLLFLTSCWLRRKGKKTYEVIRAMNDANELTSVESLQFDLATMQAATNYFSPENKLGEGGFGEVFQGRLPNGEQIAVKRLSQSSRQGDEEFKNEVLLVAKLQHRNLVRLLGFCLEGTEKLLAYEFMPNKSLDYFLFEYAMHGEFSVKSDVYSFGILLLEIICGKKNNFYPELNGGEYLATYVWNQWRDGRPLEVLDQAMEDSYSRDEVLRCLHMCLLCIQEDPAIRPTMATIVLMLSSNSITLPSPRHPAFFIQSTLQRLSIPMEELELDQSSKRLCLCQPMACQLQNYIPGEWWWDRNPSSWMVSQ